MPLYPYKAVYRDLEAAKVTLTEISTLLEGSEETPGVKRKEGVEDRVMDVHGKRHRIILEEGYMQDVGHVLYLKHFKPY